jgi:hypothetical protein
VDSQLVRGRALHSAYPVRGVPRLDFGICETCSVSNGWYRSLVFETCSILEQWQGSAVDFAPKQRHFTAARNPLPSDN